MDSSLSIVIWEVFLYLTPATAYDDAAAADIADIADDADDGDDDDEYDDDDDDDDTHK